MKNLVALSYACCDDILQPFVHKGHDMKLPLSFHATFRMKEFYDFKAEMYVGAVLRGASAQEATTQDIQHDYRRDFIKFPFHESDLPGDDHGIHHFLDDVEKLVSPTVHAEYVLARAFVSPTLERVEYVFNGPIKSSFQGGQLLGDQGDQPLGDQGDARVRWVRDPRAICGVPNDGPASKDENYSWARARTRISSFNLPVPCPPASASVSIPASALRRWTPPASAPAPASAPVSASAPTSACAPTSASAPKISLSSRDSHGYISFSDVLRRSSEFSEVVPVMFASSWESRRGLLAATSPSASTSVRPIKVMAFKLSPTSSLD